jgi:hypothetical protein
MANTTFRCGHCGNLMAVDDQYLGQQVACPTCKQIVVAPVAQPTPQTVPNPEAEQPLFEQSSFPSLSLDRDEHESIFSTPSSDDLFDDPAPVLGPPSDLQDAPDLQPIQHTPEHDPGAATLEETPAPVLTAADMVQPTVDPTPATPTWPAQAQDTNLPETRQDTAPRTRKPQASGSNWLIVFMIPLASYAIFATALIVYLIFWALPAASRSVANPIEAMPDINGEYPGGKKAGGKVLTWKADDGLAMAPLPASRKVKLGETITVGNLEVTPTKVERKVVRVFVKGYEKSEPCLNESLVLHLKLKNLSKEYAFVPLEDSFDRLWTGSKVANVPPLDALPLTVLQVGTNNFYGGPARWLPKRMPKALEKFHREWLDGRPGIGDVEPLQPGETQDTFTCTDGQKDNIVPTAMAYKGELFWRVHLRQGPVDVKGREAPVPSTTIIGVPFTTADVKR